LHENRRSFLRRALLSALSLPFWPTRTWAAPQRARLPRLPGAKPRNVILIITDDQRYDALGFVRGQPFLETPQLDALAARGVHFKNAFVTTALCSPSRASILTGLYAHQHGVVDNNHPVSDQLVFFPEYLQKAGYETALIGKWHMGGDSDAPQRGFKHWVSFRGQGSYVPDVHGLNVNGKHVPQRDYITDELTRYALEWLSQQRANRPYFLLLSHKAVHSKLVPAPRHQGRYARATFRPPASMSVAPAARELTPLWVQNQRNSAHGVDFPYQRSDAGELGDYFKRYAETLLSVDESVGAVVDHLRAQKALDSTVIVFMSDNGFAFGEHGLIDKRTAYEESMRVPLIMHCPELFPGGRVVTRLSANIDIASTLLELCGLKPPAHMMGRSLCALARGGDKAVRERLLYEYYWERNYPQTPTLHALRGEDFKYIRAHGVWDLDELYDLRSDPGEQRNLILEPNQAERIKLLNEALFRELAASDGLSLPLRPDTGDRYNLRRAGGSAQGAFPTALFKREP
jgi:N-acetylglucosamine-6-sulfatase